MSKLLSANLSRLRKSKIFWFATIVMFAISVFAILNQYMISLEHGFEPKLENFIFGYTLMIGIAAAVFGSLFFGTEYSDGTIRNKLVVGHSRVSIYFSTLITGIAAAIIMCFAYIAAVCAVGIPLFGFFTAGLQPLILMLLGSVIMVCAVCAILTAVNMLISSKTIVAIVSILGMLALLLLAIEVKQRLTEPEFYPPNAYVTLDDGRYVVQEEPIPNPNYLTGTKREVYEYIDDINPAGQALQYSSMTAVNPWQMMLYSLTITIISTFLGVFFFMRKDLK